MALNPETPGEFQNKPAPQIIILGDTKALIIQVYRILNDILTDYEGYKHIKCDFLFGGKHESTLGKSFQIFLCTIHQFKKVVVKKCISLEHFKMIAIDEADNVFENQMGKNFFAIFVHKVVKRDFKIIMTSATITENFRTVVEMLKENPKFRMVSFTVPKEKLTLKNVIQFFIKYRGESNK